MLGHIVKEMFVIIILFWIFLFILFDLEEKPT